MLELPCLFTNLSPDKRSASWFEYADARVASPVRAPSRTANLIADLGVNSHTTRALKFCVQCRLNWSKNQSCTRIRREPKRQARPKGVMAWNERYHAYPIEVLFTFCSLVLGEEPAPADQPGRAPKRIISRPQPPRQPPATTTSHSFAFPS